MSATLELIAEAMKLAEKFRDLEFKEKMHALKKRVLELEDENSTLKRRLTAKDELKPFGPHNYFYRNGQTDGPYCPICWQKDEKMILLPASEDYFGGKGKVCHVCEHFFIEEPRKPEPRRR